MEEISIVGLGFVGLPTAVILANCKNKKSNEIFSICGIDKNIQNIKKKLLNYKKQNFTSFKDLSLKKIFSEVIKKNKIKFTDNISEICNSDVVIVSINFDFKSKSKKDFNSLEFFFKNIGKNIKKGTLILFETTVPIGTCKNIIIPALTKQLNKRKLNIKDIYFAYSYERVMPGKNYYDSIVNNYRCYSGINKASKKKCKSFLKKFINYKKYPLKEFNTIMECESAKILENTFRAVNIALIDEWTKFANEFNLDLNNIINAIKLRSTHSNLMSPGLGVGGYCLTKDPDFANISSKFFSNKTFRFPITNSSIKINKLMPNTSIKIITDTVKTINKKKNTYFRSFLQEGC